MVESDVAAWTRPYFKATEQRTSILFVCFGKAPFAELMIDRVRFGLPVLELASKVDVREHQRRAKPQWFEDWWGASFGVIARHDLEGDLPLLTTSHACFTLKLDLPDQPDLLPIQTIWGLSRWLCARGADVVLDVHAFRFRTRQQVEQISFSESDVLRDVKLVLESEPNDVGLHLLHTRGLCKFARPELLCWLRPEDASLLGPAMNQIARTLMEGATPEQIRLRVADGVELVTQPSLEPALIDSLGLQAGMALERADGAQLAGVARLAGM